MLPACWTRGLRTNPARSDSTARESKQTSVQTMARTGKIKEISKDLCLFPLACRIREQRQMQWHAGLAKTSTPQSKSASANVMHDIKNKLHSLAKETRSAICSGSSVIGEVPCKAPVSVSCSTFSCAASVDKVVTLGPAGSKVYAYGSWRRPSYGDQAAPTTRAHRMEHRPQPLPRCGEARAYRGSYTARER